MRPKPPKKGLAVMSPVIWKKYICFFAKMWYTPIKLKKIFTRLRQGGVSFVPYHSVRKYKKLFIKVLMCKGCLRFRTGWYFFAEWARGHSRAGSDPDVRLAILVKLSCAVCLYPAIRSA